MLAQEGISKDVNCMNWEKHNSVRSTVYPKKYAHGFALLCFVVVIHWLIFPYPPGLLRWHCGNLTIAPVPAKQPWWIWINTSCEFIMNDCITTTKQSTTKPCAYFLGSTVRQTQQDAGLLSKFCLFLYCCSFRENQAWVVCCTSHLYLKSVAVSHLWWNTWNIDVFQKIQPALFTKMLQGISQWSIPYHGCRPWDHDEYITDIIQ